MRSRNTKILLSLAVGLYLTSMVIACAKSGSSRTQGDVVHASGAGQLANNDAAQKWLVGLQERAYLDWAPLEHLGKDEEIDVTVRVAGDGKLYEVSVHPSEGNTFKRPDRQKIADCLQAVLGAAGYSDLAGIDHGRLLKTHVIFTSRTPISNKVGAHELGDSVGGHKALVFAIPLDVLQRYPGELRKDELLSSHNVIHLDLLETEHFYRRWIAFFLNHPNATRYELIKEAASRGTKWTVAGHHSDSSF